MTLPPHVPETDFGNIPAPVGWIVGPCGQFHPNPASEVNGPGSVAWSIPCYTESSMRAYATAAVLAEREACALLCEPVAVERQDIGGASPNLLGAAAELRWTHSSKERRMSDLKFTSGHECRDNGVGDFDLFCPTQPDEKVCFLPFMTALTLKAEMVCPLCREQIGKRADS